MKKFRLLFLLLLVIFSLGLVSCGGDDESSSDNTQTPTPETKPIEEVDYAGSLTLDMNSNTKKAEVRVKLAIDGDTVHFHINEPSFGKSVIKARFLAVNTPESTGQIEPYGKKASDFTKAIMNKATSVIIESDDANWNADSTGDRYLLWIWYRTSENEAYRNLNIELLQNGLSIAASAGNTRYGETATLALDQAKTLKLNCHSGLKDPDFYYGSAIEIDLKELRTNIANYVGKRVAFEAVIFRDFDNSVYVEEYFPEDNMYYGFAIYYGFNTPGEVLEFLKIGNRLRIVGNVSEYQGTYQVSDLKYRLMKPNDPENVQVISSGHSGAYPLVTGDQFVNGVITIEQENEEGVIESKNFKWAELATASTISMNNLQVTKVYTTTNPDSASKGAMTLTCKVDGVTVQVRTTVFKDAQGNLITASYYQGKNINVVKGMVEYFEGEYQIKVFSPNDITFN